MNFGTKLSDSLIKQEATYHLPPNFTMRPFPKGPLELGTVVVDLIRFAPLNQGSDRVSIPEEERYSVPKEGITASITKSASGEAGILAKVLDRSIGGEVSLKSKRNNHDVYTIEKLETVYFYPRRSYISKCLKLPDVQDYLEGSNYEEPVYLITGLKIAWGATIAMTREREVEGSASANIKAPSGTVDVDVEATARTFGQSAMSTAHTKPADFVLGIQVLKLYHKRKHIFSKERVLKKELATRGAVLVGNNEPEAVQGDESEEYFIASQLDDDVMQGMRQENVEGVAWILPSESA
jgi:hypothetical protein